ncbi:MAG: trigger factor [bacterium]
MKIDKLEMDACRVKITVKAEAEETRKDYDAVVGYFAKNGRIPGFRVGKSPLEVIKKNFATEIREEVNTRLLRSLYKKVIEQEKIKQVNLVNVENIRFSPETGMMVSFVVDVEPTVKIPAYKKLSVKFAVEAVTDAQVDERLQHIREAFAKFSPTEEGYAVQRNDLACVDFEGKVNGQSIKDLVPEAGSISDGKAFWMQVSDDRFLPQLVAAVIGMKKGETKTTEFVFEGDHQPEALKNQTAVYTLAVTEIQCRVLPSDADIILQMKIESIEKFREITRERLMVQAEQVATRKFESDILEKLMAKADFDLPQSEMEQEINETLGRMAEEASQRGATKEDLEKNRSEIVESATAMAKRQIRVRYMLAAIGDEEKIEVTEEDINRWLEEAAGEYRLTPIQLRARVEKNERMDDLRAQVRNQKVIKMLVDTLK